MFVDNLGHLGRGPCERVWEIEFRVEDVNLYRDLGPVRGGARGLAAHGAPATARRAAHRYRDLLRPNGLGDELRAVLRTDGRPWGAALVVPRSRGRPAFDCNDHFAGGQPVSEPLAGAIRDLTRPLSELD